MTLPTEGWQAPNEGISDGGEGPWGAAVLQKHATMHALLNGRVRACVPGWLPKSRAAAFWCERATDVAVPKSSLVGTGATEKRRWKTSAPCGRRFFLRGLGFAVPTPLRGRRLEQLWLKNTVPFIVPVLCTDFFTPTHTLLYLLSDRPKVLLPSEKCSSGSFVVPWIDQNGGSGNLSFPIQITADLTDHISQHWSHCGCKYDVMHDNTSGLVTIV